jgi:hypothetical protein
MAIEKGVEAVERHTTGARTYGGGSTMPSQATGRSSCMEGFLKGGPLPVGVNMALGYLGALPPLGFGYGRQKVTQPCKRSNRSSNQRSFGTVSIPILERDSPSVTPLNALPGMSFLPIPFLFIPIYTTRLEELGRENQLLSLFSVHGLRHGRNNALLDNDTRLGRVLERLLGHPLGTDRQPERTLVLLLRFEGVRQSRSKILVVLQQS